MIMKIKGILRKRGLDIVRYHPHFERLLKKLEIDTVFDIGANMGQFAFDIHNKIPNAIIYSFEPLKDIFDQLSTNCRDIKNFKAFNFALGDKNESSIIQRSSFSPSSSILPMAELHKNVYPKSADISKETIIVKRLDDITAEIDLSGNILIKVDVQGFEDKVISGGKNIFEKAKIILIETSFVSLYEKQPLFNDISEQLSKIGFSYYGHNGQHWNEKTGELLYQDSVFVRKSFLAI